ncbi:putative acetolactate synthase large subunit [Candidatus Rhodobacter oscarellae]|uniref:Putative acetolactate synthase large subunit n=1 Tax=Candidatus Rhodobacter oscarellae TaxID=1675527 RepID=A0A0J9E233_9RHOB|nr:thiamine pyrophosphate-binding protein [Candidatus Rhodobacter lobularis]KMW56752.1 putative acetolactate synthase large subunit [Candidatus Rhodobacter lobularis]
MGTERPLGAQISAMLADRGVEVIFGIPGVHNIEMYRGIDQSGLRHVLARHEQGAAFMADGYARATGQPGVCYLITGPGFLNAATALGQAYSDSVSVLAVVACLDETALTRGQLHQMRDQEGAGRTFCDWSETARTPQAAFGLIDRALSEFESARPRPKALHVPISLASAPAPAAPAALEAPQRMTQGGEIAQEVLPYLRAAKRPLFILGGGTQSLLCPALMQRFGAASFTTYAGRGLIPASAPLHFGSYLGRPSSVDVIASADLVVAVGTELSETDLWRTELGHAAPLVRVDIDPEVLVDHHRADVPILADSHDFFLALYEATDGWEANTKWTEAQVLDARAGWRAETDAERPGIVPICDALRRAIPSEALIYSDMTQFAYVAKEVWDLSMPARWHHPTGFGTLGYALPAAIGGKIGVGDAPVLAIAGDYGFQYTVQELGTAVEERLSLPILLWDNEASKEIEDGMVQAQIAPIAVHARNPDFGALAAAYGAGYMRPADLKGLAAAVTEALAADGPTIVHMTPAMLDG